MSPARVSVMWRLSKQIPVFSPGTEAERHINFTAT